MDADLAKLVVAAGSTKGVEVRCALVQLQYAAAHSLHESTVVRDQDEGGVGAGQPRLHPLDSLCNSSAVNISMGAGVQ